MINIYEFDSNRIFTGNVRQIGDRDGAPKGWTRTQVPEIPSGKFARFVGNGWQIIDNYPVILPTYEDIAAKRYERESMGITINGMFITTGDRSKTLLNGKVNRALIAQSQGDTEWSCSWKVGTTWVTLTATQVIGIGIAVDDYVQSCFDREGELVADLIEGNPVDIDSGWPSTEITLN